MSNAALDNLFLQFPLPAGGASVPPPANGPRDFDDALARAGRASRSPEIEERNEELDDSHHAPSTTSSAINDSTRNSGPRSADQPAGAQADSETPSSGSERSESTATANESPPTDPHATEEGDGDDSTEKSDGDDPSATVANQTIAAGSVAEADVATTLENTVALVGADPSVAAEELSPQAIDQQKATAAPGGQHSLTSAEETKLLASAALPAADAEPAPSHMAESNSDAVVVESVAAVLENNAEDNREATAKDLNSEAGLDEAVTQADTSTQQGKDLDVGRISDNGPTAPARRTTRSEIAQQDSGQSPSAVANHTVQVAVDSAISASVTTTATNSQAATGEATNINHPEENSRGTREAAAANQPASLSGGTQREAQSIAAANVPARLNIAGQRHGSIVPLQRGAQNQIDQVRFVQRVARAFRAADEQGGQIRLRLSPPELGALKLEVAMRNGVMTARLETETTAARTLLLDNLPALRARLAEQSIKIERFDVDLRQEGRGDGSPNPPPDFAGSRHAPSRPQHAARSEAPGGVETDLLTRTSAVSTAADGRINVVV